MSTHSSSLITDPSSADSRVHVGKKLAMILGAVGVVLAAVAIVWWVVLAFSLTKLPSDIDVTMNLEGTLTQYVDSARTCFTDHAREGGQDGDDQEPVGSQTAGVRSRSQ